MDKGRCRIDSDPKCIFGRRRLFVRHRQSRLVTTNRAHFGGTRSVDQTEAIMKVKTTANKHVKQSKPLAGAEWRLQFLFS